MTTPQNIREKTFEKAVFGGYEMGSVDDYMETLANEIGALTKENAALKAKMKILVEKIEEYRSNENALNLAILSAQKLSVQIESDARVRAANIVSEAENRAAATIGGIDEKIVVEEDKLQAAKISTAKFFESVRELCQQQLANLDTISIATRSSIIKDEPADNADRIPAENEAEAAPVTAEEPEALDSDNTQVFTFSKDN